MPAVLREIYNAAGLPLTVGGIRNWDEVLGELGPDISPSPRAGEGSGGGPMRDATQLTALIKSQSDHNCPPPSRPQARRKLSQPVGSLDSAHSASQ